MNAVEGRDVSRETYERLKAYQALVEKWTPKINLISRKSVPEIWERHIADSVQIFDLVERAAHWVDLGSGGGFPGIPVAILNAEAQTVGAITLVESDQRKVAFLRAAGRELDLPIVVKAARIEELPPLKADVLSARALAELSVLLGFAERHLSEGGTALFPKGAKWEMEIAETKDAWRYSFDSIPSKTNPEAAILKIRNITRV